MMRRRAWLLSIGLLMCIEVNSALAGSHLWRFNEVFSNASGTVQFVELKESIGAMSETFVIGKWVLSDATGKQFVFPENLTPPTSHKHLLLATAGFAALPGAPTPDYIVPDSFFSTGPDTVRYWTYSAAIMSWGAGELPTDGVLSLSIDGTTGTNSPTNYAGETGSVVAGAPVPATSTWGLLVFALVVAAAGMASVIDRHTQRPASSS